MQSGSEASNQPAAVRVRGLVKRYGDVAAVDGLDLDIPAGSIFGFLGPNGAGKTTTIRVLLGLVRRDAGDIEVLGRPVPSGLAELRGRIGAVVDRPAIYPPLSGRANLAVIADTLGKRRASRQRIDRLLDLVGLTAAGPERRPTSTPADRRTSGYSFGMRQRLALAAALLPEPDLLILDEPANGLDPAGQQELRRVLRAVRDGGATLLISSHLLAEVEQICDHVAIIDAGRLVRAGPTCELLGTSTPTWVVGVGADTASAYAALAGAGFAVRPNGAVRSELLVEAADPRRITYTLAQAGVWLDRLERHRVALEDVFLRLTANTAGRP
jgi:ABC-2 type transport system ATP-binding protein